MTTNTTETMAEETFPKRVAGYIVGVVVILVFGLIFATDRESYSPAALATSLATIMTIFTLPVDLRFSAAVFAFAVLAAIITTRQIEETDDLLL